MAVKLGDLLLKQKLITQDQLETALKLQREEGGKIGEALVRVGAVSEGDITETLSQQFGVPSIDLAHFEIDPAVIKVVPGEVARKYGVLPVNKTGATLTIAMGDPTNVFAMDDIKFMTGYNVEPVVASEIALRKAIDKHYGTPRSVVLKERAKSGGAQTLSSDASLDDVMASSALTMDDMASVGLGELNMDEITGIDTGADVDVVRGEEGQEIDLSDLAKSSESAPIIKVSNLILIEALKAGASDIHVEPYEKEFRVRFRVDGILHNIMALPMRTRDPLISRLKIMAKLDISEKRLPQDGRIKIRLRVEERSRDLDLRVSSVPTHFGEKVVMRLLDKTKLQLDMTQLGFDQEPLRRFKDAIDRPYGIVLVTGPDGLGQDEHALLGDRRAERPDRQHHDGRGPDRVQPRRHQPGPDEGADRPDLRLGAALVPPAGPGHHPRRRDPRLRDGGDRGQGGADGPPRAVDAAHQRRALDDQPAHEHGHRALPRRDLGQLHLRPAARAPHLHDCTEDVETPPQMLIQVGFAPDEVKTLRIKRGRGCERCNNTGYKGRVGLFEVLEFTDEIRDMILSGASSIELKRKAIEEGMVSLRMSGLAEDQGRLTTLEEVLRETVL